MEGNDRGQMMFSDHMYFNLTKSKIFEIGEDDGCVQREEMVTIRQGLARPSRVRHMRVREIET